MGQHPKFNIENEDPSPSGTNMFLDFIFKYMRFFNVNFNDIKNNNGKHLFDEY